MSTEINDGNICLDNKCSACCQNVILRLTPDEYLLLKNAGTSLRRFYEPKGGWDQSYLAEIQDGKTTYIMDGRCGLLRGGLCSVYLDPGRPETCKTTNPGSEGCNSAREYLGWKPITLVED